MKIIVTGLTITTNAEIVRVFEVLDQNDEEITTTCGHSIDLWSGSKEVHGPSGRRVMDSVTIDLI